MTSKNTNVYKAQREILNRALLFAEHNEHWFSDTFLKSLEKDLEGYGELTDAQMKALDNVMTKCKMDEFLEREGLA